MGEILSDKTLNPTSGRWSTTKDDMDDLYTWKLGDEVKGTHALANEPMARYRKDMAEGKAKAKSYKHNFILIDTFKKVGEQLLTLK